MVRAALAHRDSTEANAAAARDILTRTAPSAAGRRRFCEGRFPRPSFSPLGDLD